MQLIATARCFKFIPQRSSHGRRIRTFASSDYSSDCLTTWLFRHIKKGEIKKMLFQDYNILSITRKEVNGASTQNRTENRRLQVYRFTFKLWKHVGWIVGLEPTTIHQYIHQLWTFCLLNYIHHIIFWLTTTVTASP